MEKRSLSSASLKVWHVHVCWSMQVHKQLMSQERLALADAFQLMVSGCRLQQEGRLEHAALVEKCLRSRRSRRCLMATKWWAEWSSQRRQAKEQTRKHTG